MNSANYSDERMILENVPTLPSTLVALMSLNQDDENYFNKVEDIVNRDPALALKVIHMANSALHPTIQPISCIKDALIRIGINELINITSLVTVSRVFVPSTESEKRLWLHSLQVAELIKMSFQQLGQIGVSESAAYLAGLLHDVGLFIRFEFSQEDFNKIEDLEWLTPEEHINAELKIVRKNHAELGCKVCKHWGVPSPLPQIVYFHHHYEIPAKYSKYKALVEVVRRLQFADIASELTRLNRTFTPQSLIDIFERNEVLKAWMLQTKDFDLLVKYTMPTLELSQLKFEALNL